MTVPGNCTKRRRSVVRSARPRMRPTPMAHSQVAQEEEEEPGVHQAEAEHLDGVHRQRFGGGLAPGMYFRKPNQKNTTPRETRSRVIPDRAIHPVRVRSRRSYLRISCVAGHCRVHCEREDGSDVLQNPGERSTCAGSNFQTCKLDPDPAVIAARSSSPPGVFRYLPSFPLPLHASPPCPRPMSQTGGRGAPACYQAIRTPRRGPKPGSTPSGWDAPALPWLGHKGLVREVHHLQEDPGSGHSPGRWPERVELEVVVGCRHPRKSSSAYSST